MRVTLTAIKDTERTSQRTGKPFTSRGIRTNEHGERWLSGFAGKENAGWKVGDTVEINVEEKGEYLNFTVPKSAPNSSKNNDEVLAALRQTYAQAVAAKDTTMQLKTLVTDLTRELLAAGVIKMTLSDGSDAPTF